MLVPSWTASSSTNRPSDGPACACVCNRQRTLRGHRPKEARDRAVRHRLRKPRTATTRVSRTGQRHGASDVVLVKRNRVDLGDSGRRRVHLRTSDYIQLSQLQRAYRGRDEKYVNGKRSVPGDIPLCMKCMSKIREQLSSDFFCCHQQRSNTDDRAGATAETCICKAGHTREMKSAQSQRTPAQP